MDFVTLKLIHVSAVVLSFSGFTARGIGALRGASWVRHRLARTVPHLVDTILLLSALGMLWVARLAPWPLPWLRAKIIGLIVYIALGTLALRPSITSRMRRPMRARLIAWAAAILAFGYIVSVAVTKSPLGVIVWL